MVENVGPDTAGSAWRAFEVVTRVQVLMRTPVDAPCRRPGVVTTFSRWMLFSHQENNEPSAI